MDLTVLGEMAVGVAARAVSSGGTRALLARESSVVEQAIAETCSQFEGVEAEPALILWAESPAVVSVCERLSGGGRDFGDEIVESFIEVSDFYLPDDGELRETAEQIVSAFLKALLGGLLQGSGAISVLANREEQLHFETREHVNVGFRPDEDGSVVTRRGEGGRGDESGSPSGSWAR